MKSGVNSVQNVMRRTEENLTDANVSGRVETLPSFVSCRASVAIKAITIFILGSQNDHLTGKSDSYLVLKQHLSLLSIAQMIKGKVRNSNKYQFSPLY